MNNNKDYNKELSLLEINKKPEQIQVRHIQSYTKYSPDGLIVERYERLKTNEDTPSDYHNGILHTLPNFHGEWIKVSDEEIERLNKEILEKLQTKRASALKVTVNTSKVDADVDEDTRMKLALQQAYMLLQKKLKEKEDKNNDRWVS